MTDYRFISLSSVVSIIGSDEGYVAFGTNIGMLWVVVLITSLLHVSYLVLADVVCYVCMLLSMYNNYCDRMRLRFSRRSLYVVNNWLEIYCTNTQN